MANSRNKVAQYRKPIRFNVGIVIFLIIFAYIVINVFIFFNKEHMAIYEVVEKSIADDNTCVGVVIRDEEIVKNNKAGYVNYYLREQERAAKGSTIYTVDESGNIYEMLAESEEKNNLTEESITEIRDVLTSFQKNYSDSNYGSVYDFSYNMDNALLELGNLSMLANLENIVSDNKSNVNFQIIKSDKSGVVSYSMDGMEDLSADDVDLSTFDKDKYEKTQLRSKDLVEVNSPIYRIVTNENWSIVLNLSEQQYKKLQEKEVVTITFLKDDVKTRVPITTYEKNGGYFGRVTLDRYMVRYINERFLDIEITLNTAVGLKIPVSAKVEKDFYLVPLDYISQGGNSGKSGVLKEVYNKNGEVSFEFVPADIYYDDGTYGYIDTKLLEAGAVIRKDGTGETYKVLETASLDGVYNVNKGYCVFRRIEMLYENEEYYIISDNTKYGLSAYDNIVLNGKLAVDQSIIY